MSATLLVTKQPCDPSSAFFGFMGVTSAIVFANLGAAYGTAKSGVGICSMGVMRPDMVMRSIIPVVMAGVLGIYGLITSHGLKCVRAFPLPPARAWDGEQWRPLRSCVLG